MCGSIGTTARLLLDAPSMRLPLPVLLATFLVSLAIGCGSAQDGNGGAGNQTYGGDITPGDSNGDVGDDTPDGPIVAVDDNAGETGDANQGLAGVTSMTTTGNLNLRKGPGTSYAVLVVIPEGGTVTVLNPTAQNNFLNVEFNGTSGWASAAYLEAAGTSSTAGGGVDPDGATSPDNAIARAKLSVGFSYYWGGGAWTDAGVTSSTKGSCTGSCPSCTHSGKYGADCSGMVAKAWQFGSKALATNSHPYSTVSFNASSSNWSTVSRSSLKKGDALTYNSGGEGHIVLYEKGDGWGTPTVYECRGCSYGCVYDARSFSSAYKGIRRAGF